MGVVASAGRGNSSVVSSSGLRSRRLIATGVGGVGSEPGSLWAGTLGTSTVSTVAASSCVAVAGAACLLVAGGKTVGFVTVGTMPCCFHISSLEGKTTGTNYCEFRATPCCFRSLPFWNLYCEYCALWFSQELLTSLRTSQLPGETILAVTVSLVSLVVASRWS